MATISLNDFILQNQTVQARVGDELSYAGFVHASVGNDLDYQIGDPSLLAYKNFDIQFHNPENMQAGWTGGDAATGTYTFTAKKAGKTLLRLSHLFRGQVEAQHDLEIIIA